MILNLTAAIASSLGIIAVYRHGLHGGFKMIVSAFGFRNRLSANENPESDDKSALVKIYSQTYLHTISIPARYISHKQLVRLSNKTALYFNLTNNNGYKL
jgi:hypothetical protein